MVAETLLQMPVQELTGAAGTPLYQRLAGAQWDHTSICAVAGLPLHRGFPDNEVAVGDALKMIPPITGNGMSLAFESSEIASDFLAAYASGQLSWPEVRRDLNERFACVFGRRIWCADLLHRILVRFPLLVLCTAAANKRLWNLVFRITR